MKIALKCRNSLGRYVSEIEVCGAIVGQIIPDSCKNEYCEYNKFRNGFYLAWIDNGWSVKTPCWKINNDEN